MRRTQRPDECLTRTGASGDICDVQLDRRQRRPILGSPLGDSEDVATKQSTGTLPHRQGDHSTRSPHRRLEQPRTDIYRIEPNSLR